MDERKIDVVQKLIKQADNDVQKQRLDICLTCDQLYEKMSLCKKCGCYVYFKVKKINSFCPLKKW